MTPTGTVFWSVSERKTKAYRYSFHDSVKEKISQERIPGMSGRDTHHIDRFQRAIQGGRFGECAAISNLILPMVIVSVTICYRCLRRE